MDRVRLGRALGYGARHAVKTVAAVAEAAAAPSSSRVAQAASRGEAASPPRDETPRAPTQRRAATTAQARRAGRSVWAPLTTYSSALWLRVTGLFFGMVALVMGSGAWRTRGALHPGSATPDVAHHFWVFAAFAVLFGYFAVSGFLRANVRERSAAASR